MKINWKLRFKNKTVLAALIAAVVTFVYQVLGILGIVPPISEDNIIQFCMMILDFLVIIGVITDPTTAGLYDSDRAMGYEEPHKDMPEKEEE